MLVIKLTKINPDKGTETGMYLPLPLSTALTLTKINPDKGTETYPNHLEYLRQRPFTKINPDKGTETNLR